MLFLLNAELRAVLSSYQSSQTFSKLSEDHLKSCPGTNAIFTLLFKLGLVSFKKKKKEQLGFSSQQTPEVSESSVPLPLQQEGFLRNE